MGLKSEWLEHRLRVNAAAFVTKYKSMQIAVLAGGFFSIANAGDATIDGVELEVSAKPVPNLELSGSAGWLDARYDSVTPDAVASGVRTSNALPMAPRWTANASIQYRWPLGSAGQFIGRADYAYVADRRTYANDAPGNTLDAHGTLNARLTWSSQSGRWSLAAVGRNLTDRRYLNWAEDVRATASPLGVWNVWAAPPREVSGEVSYRF